MARHGSERLGHRLRSQSAKAIQQTPLLRLIERTQRLSLRMHQRELRCKLPQHSDRRRLIVDEHAPFAVRDDLTPQQNMIRFGVDPVCIEHRSRSRCQLEDATHNRLLLAMTNHVRRSLAAQQQRQRIDQDRLPRPGLSCQQVEAQPERSDRTVDHSIVFRAQLQQHKSLRQRRIARIANLAGFPPVNQRVHPKTGIPAGIQSQISLNRDLH